MVRKRVKIAQQNNKFIIDGTLSLNWDGYESIFSILIAVHPIVITIKMHLNVGLNCFYFFIYVVHSFVYSVIKFGICFCEFFSLYHRFCCCWVVYFEFTTCWVFHYFKFSLSLRFRSFVYVLPLSKMKFIKGKKTD